MVTYSTASCALWGLAVYTRDLDKYLRQHPSKEGALVGEVVAAVSAEERLRYGETAFPYDDPAFPYDLRAFPKALAEKAAAGRPDLRWLENQNIRHEWTVKPGKRLLIKFGEKFKVVICGKDSPYEQFQNGLLGQAALPTTIAARILIAGISTATLWYPLAVYVALLLVKTGLKTYCELDSIPAAERI